jgi:nonribosomal peptide synthetase MxcG
MNHGVGRSEYSPLSSAAKGIWIGQALDPGTPAYWTAELVELEGALELPALRRAIERAVLETEALHQCYELVAGEVRQRATERRCDLVVLDCSGDPDPSATVRAFVESDLASPADLARGPLFKTAVLKLSTSVHHWYLRAHHIAFDGYAHHLFRMRVAALLDADQRGLAAPPPPAVGLCEVVAEEASYRASAAFIQDREFFVARLAKNSDPMSIARPQPLARGVRRLQQSMPADWFARLKAHAAAARSDWSAWLVAASLASLQRESGARELTIGLPVTGRLGSAGARLPCMMMNIVPLRIAFSPEERFSDFVGRVAGELRVLRSHQRYRYEDLKRDLGLAADRGRLFGPAVNLLPFAAPLHLGGATARVQSLARGPVEDVAVTLVPRSDGVTLDLEANPAAYSAADVETLARGLYATLSALVNEPHASFMKPAVTTPAAVPLPSLSLLRGPELFAPHSVIERFRRVALDRPDHPAVEQDGARSLSYGALLASVRKLARRLRSEGISVESRVLLLLGRSPQAIIAELAVLWAGGAFVPLDPDGPVERLELVLADVRPALVLCRPEQRGLARGQRVLELGDDALCAVDERQLEESLELPVDVPDHSLAYLIYTSGSTGRPNGVMIERRALSAFSAAAGVRYALAPQDRVLQFAPLQFDASIEEVFATLTTGATLVLRTPEMLESLPGFLAECERLALSVLDLPTAFFHELVTVLRADVPLPRCVRLVIIGGEAAALERVRAFRSLVPPEVSLLNTYGPTEATVVSTVCELSGPNPAELDTDAAPIGVPLPGYGIAVLDAEHALVPVGKEGELCLFGAGLSRGYFGRQELTARRFVSLASVPGAPRAYLTGDRVRLREDGELVYVGRVDDELKISGHRVHPLEAESALLELDGVIEAAVVGSAGALPPRLEAFVVAKTRALDAGALREALSRRLAPPAIPSRFCFVERLPRDANGKIDRARLRTLPAPTKAPPVATTAMEAVVLRLFEAVLGTPVREPDADFFALGGHSLLALALGQRLRAELGREVPVSTLFRHRTASALARALSYPEGALDDSGRDPLAPEIVLQAGDGPPLFCVHPVDGLAWCYFGLTQHLPGVRLHGLQSPGLTGAEHSSFEQTIDDYALRIRASQPAGPYALLGWSSGGGTAHALAVALAEKGESVSLLALLDAYPAEIWKDKPAPTEEDALVSMLDDLEASPFRADGSRYSRSELFARLRRPGSSLCGFDDATLERMAAVALQSMRTYREASHRVFHGDVLYFRAARRSPAAPEPALWRRYVQGRLEFVDVDTHHLGMCQPPALRTIGSTLAARLALRYLEPGSSNQAPK